MTRLGHLRTAQTFVNTNWQERSRRAGRKFRTSGGSTASQNKRHANCSFVYSVS
jgi:hypothetical protein